MQQNPELCHNIVNSRQLTEDLNHKMAEVNFYIPNQINDGHNGVFSERIKNANAFLSSMMGTNPATGLPLPNAKEAPFQKFMAQGGLLVLTFDEPSVIPQSDMAIYTLLAGPMINSGAYPKASNTQNPVCYPDISQQNLYPKDKNGDYEPSHCNHYNLLRLIESNWDLRSLSSAGTSAGYKYAFPLDHQIPMLWAITS